MALESRLAYLPWFSRDWLASEAFVSMSLEAQGAYRNLLDRCWCSPTCSIPGDNETLARLARATNREWARVKDAVLSHFTPTDAGQLVNDRLYREWSYTTDRRLRKQIGAAKTNARLHGNEDAKRTLSVVESETPVDAKRYAERDAKRYDIVTPASASASASASEDRIPALSVGPDRRPPKDLPPIIQAWNRATAGRLPRVMSVGARANAIRVALVEEPDVALWEKAFGLLLASPHHVGGNDRGWRADFDFALQAKQRTKWLDLARSGESPKAESLGESLARMRAEHATG